MDEPTFNYSAKCFSPGCPAAPRYKIAATWTSGALRELKNYGLACDDHREAIFERGRLHRRGLLLADDEVVGPVAIFSLEPGQRDGDRPCLADHGR
jgi:hypothetical protein